MHDTDKYVHRNSKTKVTELLQNLILYILAVLAGLSGLFADLYLKLYPGFFAAYLVSLALISLTSSRRAAIISILLVFACLWGGWFLMHLLSAGDVQPVRFRMMASFVTFLFAVLALYQQIVRHNLKSSFNLMDRVQHLSGIGSIRIDSLKQTIEFSSKAREIVGADAERMAFDQFKEMLDQEPQGLAGNLLINSTIDVESGINRSDGTRRLIRLVYYPSMSISSAAGEWVGWIEDLTEHMTQEVEQKRRAKQVKDQNQLKTAALMTGQIAHDLNNFLTAIRGNAEHLANLTESSASQKDSSMEICDAVDRASLLVKQLQNSSKQDSVMLDHLVLADFISQMSELRTLAQQEGCEYIAEAVIRTRPVQIERAPLFQVILNLVVNAIQAAKDGGKQVYISTGELTMTPADLAECVVNNAAPGEFAFIEVEDSGKGISAGDAPHIFEASFSTKQDGHGLGLSTVKSIVSDHNGAIKVESTLGKTRFQVFFPAQSAAGKKAADISVTPGATREILIVDDQNAVTSLLARYISKLGLVPLTENSGADALTLLESKGGAIDAVILDVSMPDMNGVECLRKIRAAYPDLPVIMMSGYWEESIGGQIRAGDIVGFLNKPFTVDELVDRLQKASERSSL